MSKASAAYATMFVVLVVGLWAILRIGAGLQAPADLRGAWEVRWDDGHAAPFSAMTVEQSGLFVELLPNAGPSLRGRFNREPASIDAAGPSNRIAGQARSSDRHWVISLRQSTDGAQLLGTLESPSPRAFSARKPASANSSATAPAPQAGAVSH